MWCKKMLAVCFLLVLPLAGCMGGASLHDLHLQSIPKPEKINTFYIGQIQEKTVGEVMLLNVDGWIYDGFVAIKDYQPPSHAFMGIQTTYPPIKINSEWFYKGKTDSGDIIYTPITPLFPSVSGSSANWHYCIVSNPDNEFYGLTSCDWIYIQKWPEKIPNLLNPSKIYREGSFKQELIYNGKSKDTIKLQYREYRDNLARPSFYQDLMYDLSDSRTIGFRGMSIEIIEATNSSVKFVVQTPMN